MRKVPLLAGAVSGVVAAYIASDRTLRRKLAQASGPAEAAKILGETLTKKGKDAAADLQAWLESPSVQHAINEGKDFLHDALQKVEKSARSAATGLKKRAGLKLKRKKGVKKKRR